MAGRCSVPLAQVATLNPRPVHALSDETPISFVPMAAVSAEEAKVTLAMDRPYAEVRKGYTYFETGDVLVAKITPCFENGKIAQALLPRQYGFGSTEFHVVRPTSGKLDGRYLHHFLRQARIRVEGERRMTGSGGQRRVPEDFLAHLSIPLPPLPEQRRIAAILDQADALRAKRREALAQLDSLTQSIFIEIFGSNGQSPVTVGDRLTIHPQGWTWDLLTDVARLATGHTPDRKREDYWGGEIPWITLTEIRQFDGKTASTTKERITEAGLKNSSAVLLPTGTVCFSRTASIGFVTVMGRPMATSQDFVNWVCGERLHPTYLMHAFLQSRSRLRSLSTGSTHKTIYFPTVEQFRVLVPPLDMQERFATRIQAVESLKANHRAALAESDALFASLQHRAFAGQLS